MSKIGVFPIPNEFRSEDKWFRFFNRKQAAVLVFVAIIDYRVIMLANSKGLLLPAFIIMIFFTIAVMGIVMVNLPVDALFLTGGGITLDQMLFRLLYRSCHKELYTKTYSELNEEHL